MIISDIKNMFLQFARINNYQFFVLFSISQKSVLELLGFIYVCIFKLDHILESERIEKYISFTMKLSLNIFIMYTVYTPFQIEKIKLWFLNKELSDRKL